MATPIAGLKTMPTNATKNEAIFNEDMILLEALTYRGVTSRSLLDPSTISSPAPSNGTIYLVPDGSPNAVGDWASHGGDVAVYYDGWRYLPPAEGLTLWVTDEAQSVQYRSGAWEDRNELPPTNLTDLADVSLAGSPSPQDGETLTYNAALGLWMAGAGGGGGAVVFQETVSASASVNVDLPLTTANAVSYEIVFAMKTSAAGDADDLFLRVTDDAFATVEAGASNYGWNDAKANSNVVNNLTDEADTAIRLGGSIGATGIEQLGGRLYVNMPHNASFKTGIESKFEKDSSATTLHAVIGGGSYKVESNINGVRLYISPTTGTPTITGEFHIFALVAA